MSSYGALTPPSLTSGPIAPSSTSWSETHEADQRFEKRLNRLHELLPIAAGRVIPDEEDLLIGDARRLDLTVMFLDICQFSAIDSEGEDQERVLMLLNLFMAEMLHVVHRFDGEFEKNTGDGLMAYFKRSSGADVPKRDA